MRGAKLSLVAVLAIATLAACSSSGAPAIPDTSDLHRLEELDAAIASRVKAGRYPGAVFLVAKADRLLHQGAVGVSDVAHQTPMRRDALFRTMSMTKPVTTVAVMLLVDDDKLELDAPLSTYLPEFVGFGASQPQAPTPVTIRHLLTHSSGLGFGLNTLYSRKPNLADQVVQIARGGAGDPPGKQWQYSALDGFDILARIVEVVAGEPYDRFLKRRIFDPLGMKDTAYVLDESQRTRVVGLYEPKQGTFAPGTSMLPDVRYAAGGAGLYSTGPDFIRFAQMLAGRGAYGSVRILSAAALDEISRAQLAAGFPGLPPGMGWGLGMRRVVDPQALGSPLPAGAYGWSGAFGTHFWVDPEHQLTAVFMINLSNAGGASSPDALDYERLVMQACKTDARCGTE